MAVLPDVTVRRPLTRDDVRRMEDQGLLTGRWELIDGELITKMGENAPHASVLNRILAWLSSHFGLRLRCQSAMEVYEGDQLLNAPQPDFAILREMPEDDDERHP